MLGNVVVDLGEYSKNGRLCSYEQGIKVRETIDMELLEHHTNMITLIASDNIQSIDVGFIKGLFGSHIENTRYIDLSSKYNIIARDELLELIEDTFIN